MRVSLQDVTNKVASTYHAQYSYGLRHLGPGKERQEEYMIGFCRFCGQQFMTEEEHQGMANNQATMNCTCDKAIAWKRVEEMKGSACDNIEALFTDQPDETKEELKKMVDLIAERKINSATLKISSRITASVAGGKTGIIVKRKYTEENSLES